MMQIKPIAKIHNGFCEKFGIPRQSGLAKSAQATIIFEPEYRNPDAFRGLENYSHIWLIWQFSEALEEGFRPTVRPPRLGGNTRMGVFATRSPFRPNHLGLSSVKLERIEYDKEFGPCLIVSGCDLMDKTPIFDVKPYIAYTDSHPDALSGFADNFKDYKLTVVWGEEIKSRLDEKSLQILTELLENDPRPSYQTDETRVYKMAYGETEVHFTVKDTTLTVAKVL